MSDNQDVRSAARAFAQADDRRAWVEVGATFALYLLSMTIALSALGTWWIMVPAILLAVAMGLRIYMIQHDCLHGSFFTARKSNDIVGTLLSPIALTPFKATRHIHGLHHSFVSDLDRRDAFEIYVMTLNEWHDASPLKRLHYRIYRSPITLILVGPFVFYAILRRFPRCAFRTGIGDLVLHNALLAAYLILIWSIAGWPGLAVWVATVYPACAFGALIPYVVHNFEHMHWGTKPELDFVTAALEGTSVLDWGRLFDLAMLNIGYHDLHHLNAQIPGYRLKDAYLNLEERGLLQSSKIGFVEGLRCLRWKLYDQEHGRMIPFPPKSAKAIVMQAN